MKKNFLIVAFWIFTLLGAFALKASSQLPHANIKTISVKGYKIDSTLGTEIDSLQPINALLIADETTISYLKTDCKIESSSDKVVNKIMKRYEQAVKRFSWSWKTDRHGKYKLYTIYIQKDMGEDIISWSKNNL